jgi:hypothetical protein
VFLKGSISIEPLGRVFIDTNEGNNKKQVKDDIVL